MDTKTIDKLEGSAIGGMKELSSACKSVLEENKKLVHENERLTSELGEAGKKLEEANNRVKRLEKCLQETSRFDRSRPRPPLNPPRTPGTTSPDSSDDEMGQAQAQKNNRIVSEAVASEQPSVRASPGGSVPPAASQDRPAIDMSQPPPSTRFWSEQSTDAKEQEAKKDEGKTLAKSQSFMSTGGGFGQSRRHQQTRGAQNQRGNARGGRGFNSSIGQGSGQPQSRSQQGGGPGGGRGRMSLKENNYRQQPTTGQQQWGRDAARR